MRVLAAVLAGLALLAAPAAARMPDGPRSIAGHAPRETPRPGHLIFDEEFDGPAGESPNPSVWGHDTGGGGWGNGELESYTANTANASLDGEGHLRITALSETHTAADGITRQYTSARLQTLHSFRFEHGTIEARIRVPSGQGLVAQFWALGSEAYESPNAWPDCGEIDTMEVLGSDPDVVRGHVHGPWAWAPNKGLGTAFPAREALSAGFHVYAARWQSGRISFALDGETYETVSRSSLPDGAPWPFEHPYFLLLDLAVGGSWPGPPDAATTFPATMLLDWIRVRA